MPYQLTIESGPGSAHWMTVGGQRRPVEPGWVVETRGAQQFVPEAVYERFETLEAPAEMLLRHRERGWKLIFDLSRTRVIRINYDGLEYIT
jgi:hypothetical protein